MELKDPTMQAARYSESSKSIFVVNITGRCNLRCIHCWNAQYINTELSSTDVQEVLDLIPTDTRVHFLGGEPLLHPDVLELVSYSRSAGHYTSLVTNGLLVKRIGVDKLLQSGLSEIGVSIDGPDEVTHDYIRGPGSFSKTWDALVEISDYLTTHRPNVNLLLSVCAMRNNVLKIPALIKRVAQANLFVDKVVVERVVREGRALENPELGVPPEMWLDMCEQICQEWRDYTTLLHLVLKGPPLLHNYLTSKYPVFLRDSIIGCPGLESPFGGCLTSDGSIYTCSREFLIRRAQEQGHLPLQGKSYHELVALTGGIFGLPNFIDTLGPLLEYPDNPLCQDCKWKSACRVYCPIMRLLGEEYSPDLCREALRRMPEKSYPESQQRFEHIGVNRATQTLESSLFSFRSDVYLKQHHDGSTTYFSLSLDRMVSFPEGLHAEFPFSSIDHITSLPEMRRAYSSRYSEPAYHMDIVLWTLLRERFVELRSKAPPHSDMKDDLRS